MRVIVQRVNHASVSIAGSIAGSIRNGLLVLAGWEDSDTKDDLQWMSGKIARLRIFSDAEGQMNLSINDTGGDILLISQFTLFASTKKGNRPSFIRSSKPDFAMPMYGEFIKCLESYLGKPIQTGIFGAEMKINLENAGPVTIFMDSKNKE
jgi:D-tyrosyl-tRNA(Tyr) deacylase